MKKATLILLAVLAAQVGPTAQAAAPDTYTVVLAGGAAENMMKIWLTPDGYSYVIDSVVPLEVGGSVCENPSENPNELICKAPQVVGFEVNAGPGDDSIWVAAAVKIPVTMRGGPGRDRLRGGSGPDKLIGGPGADLISGKGGDDLIFGGPGKDVLMGGRGDDLLRGGPGDDRIGGGRGVDDIRHGIRGRA